MKICVIGNSHVAAIKKAAHLLDISNIDFYAIPGAGAPDLICENGKVFPDYSSSKGVTYPSFKEGEWVTSNIPSVEKQGLKLSNYDCILYSGVGLPALRSTNINPLNQVFCSSYISFNDLNTNMPLVSHYCFGKLLDYELDNNASISSLKLLMDNFKGQILVQHFPLPSKSVLEQEDFIYKNSHRIEELIYWYFSKQVGYIKKLLNKFGNADYLFDVFELADKSGFTNEQYAQMQDAWHMNEHYGVEILQRLLKRTKLD